MCTSAQHLALTRMDFGELGELGSLCCLVQDKSLARFLQPISLAEFDLVLSGMLWVLLSEGCESCLQNGVLGVQSSEFPPALGVELVWFKLGQSQLKGLF